MKTTSLEQFTKALSKAWGPLDSELTKTSQKLLETLSRDCLEEAWLGQLLEEQAPVTELYKDEQHGFMLLAHVEQKGEQSPPHDHGNGWVIYATVLGATEMGIYNALKHPNGTTNLVQKDRYTLEAGQSTVYLPGDIHHTSTLENNTLTFRLTSCDFLKELQEGRLIRYQNTVNKW